MPSVPISDVQNAFRAQNILQPFDTNDPFKRLQIWQNVWSHTTILQNLHSKITPERPQITPDHTRSYQNHAFGTYFLLGHAKQFFFAVPHSHSPPQTEGNHPYFK